MNTAANLNTSGVEKAMRNAVPILFWSAVVLFGASIASVLWTVFAPDDYSQAEPAARAALLLTAIVQGLNSAAWPFTGAALVWTIGNAVNRTSEAAE